MTDTTARASGAQVESAEKAADQVALLVFFSGVSKENLTVGDVRDAALKVILQDRAQVRRAALEEAALLCDSLMATYYVNEGMSSDERDASTAIRTMLLKELPS